MFSLFNFSSIFPGVSADPICPYVRTPMQPVEVMDFEYMQHISRRAMFRTGGAFACDESRYSAEIGRASDAAVVSQL